MASLGSSNIYTGSNFLLDFGRESAFNDGITNAFDMGLLGTGLKLSTYTMKNNYNPIYGVNQRTAKEWYSEGVAIDVTSDFYLTDDNKSWLDFILTGSGGSSTVANTAWTSGLTVDTGYAQVQSYFSAYELYTISGIVYDSAKLTVKNGSLAEVSLSGTGTKQAVSTPASGLTVTPPTNVLSWKDATVTIGNPLSGFNLPIQELDLTISTNKEQVYGLGSVEYQGYYLKQFQVEGTLSVYHDSGLMESLFEYGSGSSNSDIALTDELELTIGSYTFDITGLIRNQGQMNIPPVDEVTDQLSFMGTSISVS